MIILKVVVPKDADGLGPANGQHTSLQDHHLTDVRRLTPCTLQGVVTVAVEIPHL